MINCFDLIDNVDHEIRRNQYYKILKKQSKKYRKIKGSSSKHDYLKKFVSFEERFMGIGRYNQRSKEAISSYNWKSEYMKEYYKKNKKSLKKYMKEYKNRPEVKSALKEYRRKYIIQRLRNDPSFRISFYSRMRLRAALKSYTKTGKTRRSKLYGINYQAIIEHLKPFPKDLHLYHIDHIKPLCSFNLEDPEEVKKAFAPENHQWLLAEENLKKSGKIEKQEELK